MRDMGSAMRDVGTADRGRATTDGHSADASHYASRLQPLVPTSPHSHPPHAGVPYQAYHQVAPEKLGTCWVQHTGRASLSSATCGVSAVFSLCAWTSAFAISRRNRPNQDKSHFYFSDTGARILCSWFYRLPGVVIQTLGHGRARTHRHSSLDWTLDSAGH